MKISEKDAEELILAQTIAALSVDLEAEKFDIEAAAARLGGIDLQVKRLLEANELADKNARDDSDGSPRRRARR